MTLREKIEKMKRSDNPLLMDTASWNAAINAVLSLLDAEQPQPDCLPADKAEESATKLGFGVFESEAGKMWIRHAAATHKECEDWVDDYIPKLDAALQEAGHRSENNFTILPIYRRKA